jgi:hypothetical protein
MRYLRPTLPLACMAAFTLLLGGCGGSPDSQALPSPPVTAHGTVNPATFVSSLLKAVDSEDSVHLTIDAESFGSGEADVSYGHGPTKIHVTGDLTTDGRASFVIANGVVYVEQGAGGQYTMIDKNDPAYGPLLQTFTQVGPHESIAGLGQGITSVTSEGTTSVGDETLQKFAVTANPSTATGAFRALAGTSNVAGDLMFDFYVDGDNLLRQVETDVSGEHVTVTLDDWGDPVSITVPSGEQLATS